VLGLGIVIWTMKHQLLFSAFQARSVSRRLLRSIPGLAACISLSTALAFAPAWSGNSATRIEIAINGMVCSFCVRGIESRLKTLPGAAAIHVDLQKRLVTLQVKSGDVVSDERLRTLIRDAGYDVRRIERISLQP
jgi:mercuric ion binding protein